MTKKESKTVLKKGARSKYWVHKIVYPPSITLGKAYNFWNSLLYAIIWGKNICFLIKWENNWGNKLNQNLIGFLGL